MLKYYLLLFVRNLKRQRLFSAINLMGLTVSMASTLLIYLYVSHEFSYDRFHHDVDRIYRVNQTFIWGENNNNQFASTGPGVAYSIKEEIPEVELITSLYTPGNQIVSYTNASKQVVSFEEGKILAADTNFFSMFNFPMIKGNPKSALGQANTMVITESTARKYFGAEDPIGKLVRMGMPNSNDQKTYEVTGVVEDSPDNSYIDFDMLISLRGYPIERFSWSWVWTQLETYIRLDPRTDYTNVLAKIQDLPRKRVGETLKLAFNTTYDEYVKSGKKWELFLQPMTSIHLPEETVINRLNSSGNKTIIYSFIGAAIFIVLLSCVNFMNLSTAQFTRRVKEAGVRKILGLGRKELSLSYFFEALTFCTIAMMLALGVTQLLLPAFNLITEKSLHLNLLHPQLLAGISILLLLMAIVSASYPALFLSSFHPVEAVKGKLKMGREGKTFRSTLVVFQFCVSIVLIICTGVVFQQLKFVADKDLGFNKENLLVLNHVEAVKNGEDLANAALGIPGVQRATWCNSVPPEIWGGDSFGVQEKSDLRFPINFTGADENYIPTLNLTLKVGRNFSKETPADVDRVIVNESTIRKIGWDVDESVLGKKLTYDNATFEIIGVVADFNYWSISNPIEPFAIFNIKTEKLYPEMKKRLVMKMESQSNEEWSASMAALNTLWKQYAGDTPFDFSFVDQAFANTFKSQRQFGQVLTIMASLAIIIASLGLLGMIIYALEQRTKEIGIRKVSGASVWDILKLISKGYTKLILIAFVIGAPFSYWLMEQWLKEFAYKITPSLWIYATTGLCTLIVAILITSYHSVKAALTNPVDVLKDE